MLKAADKAKLPSAGSVNVDFVKSFYSLGNLSYTPTNRQVSNFAFPSEFADHVIPGPDIKKGGIDNPHQYLTSDNCYGCHGGLGSAPYGLSMFVRDGDSATSGYNVSEFGEWRWSPMGLAGRDPIFHAQLESELALLYQEFEEGIQFKGNRNQLDETQQALIDTCLRCHGAMGLRQFGIDHPERSKNENAKEPFAGFNPNIHRKILNPGFNPNLFYIAKPITQKQSELHRFGDEVLPRDIAKQTPEELQKYHKYGELAREGISCTICHHIAPPDGQESAKWVKSVQKHLNGGSQDHTRYPKKDRAEIGKPWIGKDGDLIWSPNFFFFTANRNTGLFDRSEANELLGPFNDVVPKPMQNALGITPTTATVTPPITNVPSRDTHQTFTADSAMCGTCHSINLPNVGATVDEYPILTLLEPNEHFQSIPHSIDQATYLEWINSAFGPGALNKPGKDFKSCQDCHMPNRFATVKRKKDGSVQRTKSGEVDYAINIDPLVSQIATIQDSKYPQADHELPAKEINVKHRSDYQRHEHVGLNAFMVEMAKQFPEVLGVSPSDYETGAGTGADLAIDNMRLSAVEDRVATIEIGAIQKQSGQLRIPVTVTNQTGHRFPSGVAFRRAFVELLVKDKNDDIIWSSGRTDRAGLIIDEHGKRLRTEFLNDRPQGRTNSFLSAASSNHHAKRPSPDLRRADHESGLRIHQQFYPSCLSRERQPIAESRIGPRKFVCRSQQRIVSQPQRPG